MIKGILTVISASALAMLTLNTQAEVRLPKVFGSHMVLQQNKPVVIWGWADPGEQVEARIGGATGESHGQRGGRMEAVTAGHEARRTADPDRDRLQSH